MPALPTSIGTHCAGLPDPRVERAKEHPLVDIVTSGVCAVICGADSWPDMATFAEAKARWLRTFLALPGGVPSHDTFGRVFARLDPEAFGRCFAAWVRAVAPDTLGHPRAVDGQTPRGSRDRADGRAAPQLVGAWADDSGLVPAQMGVDDKANEIVAIPALLRLLDRAGRTVTIDALGCQAAIAAQIAAQGGDDALALKDHHPTRHDDVRRTFAEARADGVAVDASGDRDAARTVGKDHGRLEIRRAWTLRDPELLAHLDPAGRWARLRAIGRIEAERHVGEAVAVGQRHYLLSAPPSAAAFGRAVRSHRGIENRVQWVLDVPFREEACRVRADHGARTLAVPRHIALHRLRREHTRTGSIATRRFQAALDGGYLAAVLVGVAGPPPSVPE